MKIGIDIGSTTAKLVIRNDSEILYEKYERHFSQVRQKTLELLKGAKEYLDGHPIRIAISGSAGLGVAEAAGIPFVQEVYATYALIQPTFSLCYPLVKKRWFAKLQFHSLHIKKDYFEEYYRDSAAITKENMIAFLRENSDYQLKAGIEECQTKTMILVGSRESNIMKKSAKILHEKIPNSSLEILPGFHHGDLSLNHSQLYIQKILSLITD